MAVGRIAEGHLAAGRPFGRAAVATHEVGRVVVQNFPQPGEPLLLGAALEAIEIAAGFEHRLLHQVRSVDLPPQPRFDLRSGDEAQVGAAQGKQPLPARGVTPPSPFDQHGELHRLSVTHGHIIYRAMRRTDKQTKKTDRNHRRGRGGRKEQDKMPRRWLTMDGRTMVDCRSTILNQDLDPLRPLRPLR